MKKLMTICLLATIGVLGVSAQKGFCGFTTNDQKSRFMDQILRKQDADYDKKSDIKWNFTKFLVSRNGRVVKRYEPTEEITDIETDICSELHQN